MSKQLYINTCAALCRSVKYLLVCKVKTLKVVDTRSGITGAKIVIPLRHNSSNTGPIPKLSSQLALPS